MERQVTKQREKTPDQTVYKDFITSVLQKDLSVCYRVLTISAIVFKGTQYNMQYLNTSMTPTLPSYQIYFFQGKEHLNTLLLPSPFYICSHSA